MTVPEPPIPITILTGFLGSGKTTLLLNLLPQLPPNYTLCLLKNEFGDVAVDSQLSLASSISGVTELLNGCICCNLVGQLSDSLLELRDRFNPDRIVIETSGSAFPATLAMEVNRLAATTNTTTASVATNGEEEEEEEEEEEVKERTRGFILDGTILVVDVENWKGYDDSSYTARLQFKYTDLVVLNKWESCSERLLDDAVDRIRDLNDETPYVRSDKGFVQKEVVFGIDGALAGTLTSNTAVGKGVEHHDHDHDHGHSSEVDVLSLRSTTGKAVDGDKLSVLLKSAPREEVYRIKGVLDMDEAPEGYEGEGRYILNWAFGRWNFTKLPARAAAAAVTGAVEEKKEKEVRITVVLARGEGNRWKKKLEGMLEGVTVEKIV